MKNSILTMFTTPTLTEEKEHESVRKTLHVSSDNVDEVKINAILTEHNIENCGVLELCRKCGFADADILKALQESEWDRDYLHYTVKDGYYIECLSCRTYIARADVEHGWKLCVTQDMYDILHGSNTHGNVGIQHIKDLALFCRYYNLDINNIAGIYSTEDKFN